MNLNMVEVYKKGKWVWTTQFERYLDQLDKALELRYFLATQERPYYDHEAYENAAQLTFKMFGYICNNDKDIIAELDHLWLDSNSDIRYILEVFFLDARWEALSKAEEEAEERAYQISEGNLNSTDNFYYDEDDNEYKVSN